MDLLKQDLLVRNKSDELVSLRTIIHGAVLIVCFWKRKYVYDAPVVKPDSTKPGQGCLHSDDLSPCIAVDTDEPPTCVRGVFH